MRLLLSAFGFIALLLAACGGGAPAADGSGSAASGGGAGGGGAGGGGGGDLPAGSTVIFGTAFDPTSLAVTGKTTSVKVGTPIVAVGRAFTVRAVADTVVQAVSGSNRKPARPVSAANGPESADLFAFDLSPDGLTPGTWVISFTSAAGKIVASGFLTVTP